MPLKIRAKGAALAAAADFLGNFLVVEITPPSLANIGYRTYIIWAVLNIANAIIVWLFYPETSGIPLEKIDMLFTGDWMAGESEWSKWRLDRKLQWSVVGRASKEVKRQRRLRREGRLEDAVEGSDDASSKKSGQGDDRVDKV